MRNELSKEKSPYLLQHAHNPVAWQAWGDGAFELARELDRPVFLSVGYSTCHWCHVMERESFESEAVAAVLNGSFVPIKVDREERPDIDRVYMDAVQAIAGRGGWPMSVWLTPEGRPFYGGTYFPTGSFIELLQRISFVWMQQREQVLSQAAGLFEAISAGAPASTISAESLDPSTLHAFLAYWQQRYDSRYGGMGGAPKFPAAADLRLLLRIHRRSGDESALLMARQTLLKMCRGGIYDHLGGGFARYSVDHAWLVPHFEKMLYDQASLLAAYVEAWQVTGEPEFSAVALEIARYVQRDLIHPDGGLYSAEDADSEGVEGKFYVWSASELRAELGADFAEFAETFGVTDSGNFEHGNNILSLQEPHSRQARSSSLQRSMAALLKRRAQRTRPALDDKILSDWNGLMIGSLAQAGRTLGQHELIEQARRAARFVTTRMTGAGDRLYHRWRLDEAAIAGFLDDYAFMIQALIELYMSDFDAAWLELAQRLQRTQDELFWDEALGDYRSDTGSDPRLPKGRRELYDNVVPAGRSVAALNQLRLASLLREEWRWDRALRLFGSSHEILKRHPGPFPQLLIAVDAALCGGLELALVGDAAPDRLAPFLAPLRRRFLPGVVVASGDEGSAVPMLAGKSRVPGSTIGAFICRRGSCQLPCSDPQEMERRLLDQY